MKTNQKTNLCRVRNSDINRELKIKLLLLELGNRRYRYTLTSLLIISIFTGVSAVPPTPDGTTTTTVTAAQNNVPIVNISDK